MNKISLLAVAALAFAAPAFAQDAPVDLQVESGTVMTSTGGEFETAVTGEPVVAGERVMVGENSSVLVRFANNCVIRFTQPGVHLVPNGCVPGVAGATSAGGVAGTTVGSVVASNAGIIGVSAVIAAAGVASSVANDPVPVSP